MDAFDKKNNTLLNICHDYSVNERFSLTDCKKQ